MDERRTDRPSDAGRPRLRRWLPPVLILVAMLVLIPLSGCFGGDDESGDETTVAGGLAGADTPSGGVTTTGVPDDVDLTKLPLGDGYISLEPETGSVFSCQVDFPDNAGGALVDGPWINTDAGTWNAEKKVAVPGEIMQPAQFDVAVEGGKRVITGNDLPDEPTGEFPVAADTKAYEYDRNPNQIIAQDFEVDLPANPKQADAASCTSLGAIGVLLDGGYLFNALDGPGRDAVAHEIQDECDGHPERTGAYHYHSLSSCIDDPAGDGHSPLVGYAIDGFGIYGRFGEDGETLTNGDLDECHGHTHEIEWDGKQVEMYHYHATYEYPYTIGCFRGTPSEDEDLGALDPGAGAPPGGGA